MFPILSAPPILSLKWCIVIPLKTCGHYFAILKPQASRHQDFLSQSLLLMQTEINYVQHFPDFIAIHCWTVV